jgi:hypothetical protein
MSDHTAVQTRHLANLAHALAEAVEEEPRRLETFEAMGGRVTVVRDEVGADVTLHDRGTTVHVRLGDTEEQNGEVLK